MTKHTPTPADATEQAAEDALARAAARARAQAIPDAEPAATPAAQRLAIAMALVEFEDTGPQRHPHMRALAFLHGAHAALLAVGLGDEGGGSAVAGLLLKAPALGAAPARQLVARATPALSSAEIEAAVS